MTTIILSALLVAALVALLIYHINLKERAEDARYWRQRSDEAGEIILAAGRALGISVRSGTAIETAILRNKRQQEAASSTVENLEGVLKQLEGIVNVPALDRQPDLVSKVRYSISQNQEAARAGFISNKAIS